MERRLTVRDDTASSLEERKPSSAEGYRVRVLDRIVAILECFTIDEPELGVGEIARRLELSKATVHRLLTSLEEHLLVQQNPVTQRYRLGFRVYDLGQHVLARLNNVEFAGPHLQELALAVGETAHLAILDDGMAYYVAKVESHRSLRMPSQVGKQIPTHCTAVGKTLLASLGSPEVDHIVAQHGLTRMTKRTIVDRRQLGAELARIRERGWALDDEETEEGLRCIAAPVRDHTGAVTAAVSVSGPSTRFTDEALTTVSAVVMGSAVAISEALGGGRPTSD